MPSGALIAHAKDKREVRKWPYYAPNPLCGGAPKGWRPTVFLTRFAEELRRAPEAGPDKSTGQAGGNVGRVKREGLSQGLKFFSG